MSKIRVDEIVDVVDEGSPDLPYGATCAEPTAGNHVATKSYVDSMLSGGFANSVSSTPPANAAIGSFWVDNSTSLNVLKCWNGSVWEEFSGMAGGVSYLMGIVDPVVLTPPHKSGYPTVSYIPSTSEITNIDYHGGDMATSSINISADFTDLAYGDGKFVCVTRTQANNMVSDRRVQWSADGINWTNVAVHQEAETNHWTGVTYGNGKWVAVAKDGTNRVMWSTDATTWNAASAALDISWSQVTYGEPNGQPTFVAVAEGGSGNRSMYSYDGINWQSSATTDDANNMWTSVTYGDGKFVAIAKTGVYRAMYSTDGINWISCSQGLLDATYIDIAYGEPNGQPMFVVVPMSGKRAHYSLDLTGATTNGLNWAEGEVPKTANWRSVAYGEPNGKPTYVAIAEDSEDVSAGYTMYSHDGINWVNAPGAVGGVASIEWGGPIAYGGGKFVKFATWAMYSTGTAVTAYSYDGTSWSNPNQRLTFADDKIRMLDTGEIVPGATLETILNGMETLYDADSYGGTAVASGNYMVVPGTPSNVFALLNPFALGDWTVGMKARSTRSVDITYPDPWPIWDTGSSSIPTVSKGAISKWGTVEWNVAEDSTFTTNLQKSIVNIVRDVPQTVPSDIIIEANKEYYIRVRYGSLEPAVSFSNWSEVNAFKTVTVTFPGVGASPWTDPNTGVIYTYTNGVWYGTQPAS